MSDEAPDSPDYNRCPRCEWSTIATTGICDHCGWGAPDAPEGER